MKKPIHFLVSLLFVFSVLPASAQWTVVTGFNQVISDFEVFENEMHIVGGFTKRAGNTAIWHSIYNGSSFQDNTEPFALAGIHNMAVFNNTLYAVGSGGYYTWDGSEFTNTPENSHGSIYSDGNLLYLGSDFGMVRHMDASGNMTTYPALKGFSSSVQAIIKYKGELIIAGRFDSSGTTELKGLARWDGNVWQPMGSGEGISGGVSGSNVMGMTVYKDELYIYGSFTEIDGKKIASIAKWNGTQWSDVGGSNADQGLSNGIRDAIVHNNELYVCGDFDQLGTTPAKYVAVWDGQSWRALDLNETDNFPNCIKVYNNELYVGTFDFEASNIYKRAVSASIAPTADMVAALSIYPNPAHGQFSVFVVSPRNMDQSEIVVRDMSGKIRYTSRKIDTSVDCSGWPAGIYFVNLTSASGSSAVRKIVVY